MVLLFASSTRPLAGLMEAVSGAFPQAVVLGATTAGEFSEEGDSKGSVSAVAISGDFRVFAGLGEGLQASPERAIEQALEGLPREVQGYPCCTALLLLDPLAGNGEEVTLLAAAMLGEGVRLAGGAAGDDLQMKQTWVGLGPRAASDAVVIGLIFSRQPLGVGVCHGHEPISRPIRVTKASGGVVNELEGRPAWDVWREETKLRASERGIDVERLEAADEGAFLLRFEAGLAAGENFKIRAPLSRSGGALNFACGVPEGAVVRITESVPERQIESARLAARLAREQLRGREVAGALVFDCICRKLILGERFQDAVKSMSEELGGVPLAGFETYGEIALDVGDMSGFHNTTSVVLAFPR